MSRAITSTIEAVKSAARAQSAVLVSYSGGKDSLCVLDLCKRHFARVEGFYMYMVQGLECIEEALALAEKRWGLKVRQYPHWVLARSLADGAYCFEHQVPEWTLKDVWALARAESGIKLVANGAKAADSMWRRRNLGTSDRTDLLYPLEKWNKLDVLTYLKANDIPLPPSSGKSATGIDLSQPSLLWLHDTYPRDFKKLCEVFPHAEAVIYRRKWFGVGEYFGKAQPGH